MHRIHSVAAIVLGAVMLMAPATKAVEVQPIPAEYAGYQMEAVGPVPASMGAGHLVPDRSPCLEPHERLAIQAAIAESRRRLGLRASAKGAVSFDWPIRPASHVQDYGVHGISNFVDLNASFPDQLLDYNCGARTYDNTAGYNHQGTDIFTWPFSWLKMQNDDVEVIAAAAGTIVFKSDGNFDMNCGFGGGGWNAVYVEHADGSVAWYGHMKNGSLTSKGVGQTVTQGEFLGVVGSSGNSTGPHLHFEVYDGGGSLLDPYSGPCRAGASWWASQRPYYDSAVNALYTQTAGPGFPTCPQVEATNISNQFDFGDTVAFAAYYRDQRSGQLSTYTIYRPNGSTFSSWTASLGVAHYAASYWWWNFTIPQGEQAGEWEFEIAYEGQTYEHRFQVGAPVAADEAPASIRLSRLYPNPMNPTTNIAFVLGQAGHVQLDVLNVAGRHVRTLASETLAAGSYTRQWNGQDDSGRTVASGVYFVRLGSPEGTSAQKLTVAK